MFVFCPFSIPELCHQFLLCSHIQSDNVVSGCINGDLLLDLFGCSLRDSRAKQAVPAHKKTKKALQCNRIGTSRRLTAVLQQSKALEVIRKSLVVLRDRLMTSH